MASQLHWAKDFLILLYPFLAPCVSVVCHMCRKTRYCQEAAIEPVPLVLKIVAKPTLSVAFIAFAAKLSLHMILPCDV